MRDPLCGMTVAVADAEAAGLTTEYEGMTYAFCGSGCQRAFADEPATYAAKAEHAMTDRRTIAPTEDPVCGMTVDPGKARAKGSTLTHEDTDYAFCGKGCLLEFRDDPDHFLDPAYKPLM